MEFTIQLTLDNWRKATNVWLSLPNESSYKPPSLTCVSFIVILMTALFMMYFIQSLNTPNWESIIIIGGYFSSLYCIGQITSYKLKLSNLEKCQPSENSSYWDKQHICLTEQQIVCKRSSGDENYICWNEVFGIVDVDNVIYILLKSKYHIYLPKIKLEDPEAVLQKLKELHTQYNQDSQK